MARASHIYIILAPGPAHPTESTYKVVAAFTVKQECRSYLEDADVRDRRSWIVKSYRDGGEVRSPTEADGVLVRFGA